MAAIESTFRTFMNSWNRQLEPHVQHHLRNVYACMSMTLLTASLGGYFHLYTNILQGGILSSIVGLGLALALVATPDNGKNQNTRIGYMLGFGLCSGLSLGPLLNMAMLMNPALIPTALLSTCVIFGCFTLSAIFSGQRKYLYLGGILTSMLSILLVSSLINIFIGSRILSLVHLYVGFGIACMFILYDTTLIIEKRRRGETDYIWHSVLLFIDFIDVFRHVLVFLMKKEADKDRRRK